jgi:hypothetical protein
MPLLLSALTESPGLPGAGGGDYPETVELAALQWRMAVEVYAAGVIPPSATVSAAGAALEPALVAAFQTMPVAPALEAAFLQFAVALGGGMAGFVPTPPAAPIGFEELFALPPPETREEGVLRVAMKIDVWMRTGIAALAAPPNTPQPWS